MYGATQSYSYMPETVTMTNCMLLCGKTCYKAVDTCAERLLTLPGFRAGLDTVTSTEDLVTLNFNTLKPRVL